MKELQLLLENFWITREYDKELYYQVKRALPSLQHFLDELAGWRVIRNEKLIKLEKIPVKGESFMGIQEFQEPKDYIMLCGLLIFLEDLDDGKQFLLSELIETLETFLSECIEVDWTKFSDRKSLVRVLKFAESIHMLVAYEGSSDSLASGIEHEILYENTNLSRFFATHFVRDISSINSVADLEKLQSADRDETRGYTRINRVYRQLTLTPAMYWDSVDDPDSLYLRNQRQWVQKYMEEALAGQLQIHKNAAFFVLTDKEVFGSHHPREAMLPEFVLLFCQLLRNAVIDGVLQKDLSEKVSVSKQRFDNMLLSCRTENMNGFSKEYREMDDEKLVNIVSRYMLNWKMIECMEDSVCILPAAGKFVGYYPEHFTEKFSTKEEHSDVE